MSAKRILSGLLAMVLLLGCIPMTALAEETAPVVEATPATEVVAEPTVLEIITEPVPTEAVIPETTEAPAVETTAAVEEAPAEETTAAPTEAATEPEELPVIVITEEAAAATAGGALSDGVRWDYDAETFTLTISGSGYMPDDYSPWSEDNGKIRTIEVEEGVCSIGQSAFADMTALTRVTLPSTLEYIDAYAFQGSSLPKLEIPAGVGDIGIYAFADCKSLKKITFAGTSSLEIVGSGAFEGSALAEIALPASVTTIGSDAFAGCTYLKNLTLAAGLKTIGAYAFKGTAMETITIPDTVTMIGDGAFQGSTLTAVKVPGSVKAVNVGTGVFKDCDALATASVPSFWAQIPAGMFEGCHVLTGFDIPANVTKIGAGAFKYCYALTNITLPAALTMIGEGAFAYCEGIQEIVIPKNVEVIQHEAFGYCANLKLIRFEGDAPAIAVNDTAADQYGSFYKVTADVLYPRDNVTWTAAVRKNYGGTLSWNFSHPLNVSVDPDTGKPQLTWGKVDGAVKYKIYRSAKADTGFKLLKTYTDTNKVSYLDQDQDTIATNKMVFGNTYYYKLVTVFDDDTEKTSDVVGCRPTLARPKNVTAKQNANGKTVLSWTAVANATSYEIYRNNKYLATAWVNSYIDTTAKADTVYEYQVRAVHGIAALNSAYSHVVRNLEPLNKPVISVTTVPATGKAKITWQPVEGAVKYQVWYSTTGKAGSYSLLVTTTAQSHTHKNGKAGVIYYYKVKAIHENPVANSAFSTAVFIRCGLAQPVLTVGRASGKPQLTWPKIDGANGYQIWIAAAKNGAYSYLTAVTGTSYTHTAAVAGTTYYYKVRAYSTTTGLFSEFSAAQSSAVKLNRPTGLKVVNNAATGKNVISWNKVSGAAKYQVWYSKTGKVGSYSLLMTTKNLTHTHQNGVAGTLYYYKVKAIASAGSSNSDFSGSYQRTCDLPQPTGIRRTTDAATGKNVISWNKVSGAEKYQVWYSTTGATGSFKVLMTTKNLTHTHKMAIEGKDYFYKVKAVHSNANANSAFSATVSSITPKVTVTVANVEASGKVKLSWNAVAGAAKYEVWYSTSTADYSFRLLTTTAVQTYTHTTGVAGTEYYYKVKEVYADTSKPAAFSAVVNCVCDLAQPNLTVTHDAAATEKNGVDCMRLSWTDVGADHYVVYYDAGNGKWTTFDGSTTTKTTLLMQENSLTFKVQAIHSNPDANSAMSEAATLAK